MTSACLDATFSALADPTRRAILARLSMGETSVQELARPFRITGPAITKHLQVLQRVGLIKRSRRAQWRPCRLEAKPLREVADWVERYRQFWESSFDRLDDYFRTIQKEKTSRDGRAGQLPISSHFHIQLQHETNNRKKVWKSAPTSASTEIAKKPSSSTRRRLAAKSAKA